MEISQELRQALDKYRDDVNNYQFQNIYNKLGSGRARSALTMVLLSVNVDPAGYLKYIPAGYLYRSDIISYEIPSTVKSIGDSAFLGCRDLTEVLIPSGVEVVDCYAFQDSGLTDITIPDSVTSIGVHAFANCKKLKTAHLSQNISVINDSLFSSCDQLESVDLPTHVTSIKNYAFEGCNEMRSITIPNTVRKFEYGIFNRCYALADIFYQGTSAQWHDIQKIVAGRWAMDTPDNCTVHCIDKDLNLHTLIREDPDSYSSW